MKNLIQIRKKVWLLGAALTTIACSAAADEESRLPVAQIISVTNPEEFRLDPKNSLPCRNDNQIRSRQVLCSGDEISKPRPGDGQVVLEEAPGKRLTVNNSSRNYRATLPDSSTNFINIILTPFTPHRHDGGSKPGASTSTEDQGKSVHYTKGILDNKLNIVGVKANEANKDKLKLSGFFGTLDDEWAQVSAMPKMATDSRGVQLKLVRTGLPIAITWKGGVKPFRITILDLAGASLVSSPGILAQAGSFDEPRHGYFWIEISDTNRDMVRFPPVELVGPEQLPLPPDPAIDLTKPLHRLAYAAWLANQDGGVWGLEAYRIVWTTPDSLWLRQLVLEKLANNLWSASP